MSPSNTFTARTRIGGRGEHESRKPEPTAAAKVSEQTRRSPGEFRTLSIRPIQRDGPPCIGRAGEGACLGVHRLLQEGADPNTADRDRVTPLHLGAGRTDGAEVVERLLKAGASPHARDSERSRTPLHLAVQSDSPEAVNHLLQANANPNARDADGATPLHYAASNRSPDVAQALAGAGADPNARDNAGRTPVDVATARDSTPTVNVLLEARAQQQQPNDKERRGRRAGKTTDAYHKEFADDIIAQIERGTAPWQKHWKPGENRMPENFSTGARYQGGNALQLMVKRTQRAWNDNRWGTYKQIKEAGGQVRKGERGTTVLVYKPPKRADGKEATPGEVAEDKPKNPDAEKTTRPMWRRYTVFNVEQAEGLKLSDRARAMPGWEAQQNVERVIRAVGVRIREVNGDRAYYNMHRDEIVLPERSHSRTRKAITRPRSMKSATAPATRAG